MKSKLMKYFTEIFTRQVSMYQAVSKVITRICILDMKISSKLSRNMKETQRILQEFSGSMVRSY